MALPRVVSLVPSATETLRAWGIDPIAVTRFCPEPRSITVGGTKDPDVEQIAALRPDLVVMCVEENRHQDAAALAALGMTIHPIDIDGVDDVVAELAGLAQALQLEVELPVVPDPLPDRGLTAFVPIWRRPWMTISTATYAASVLRWLGIGVVTPASTDRYPTVELDEIIGLHPDVVVAPDEPYPFAERHRGELERVAPAVFVDGQDLVWWGTRTPAALDRLAVHLDRSG